MKSLKGIHFILTLLISIFLIISCDDNGTSGSDKAASFEIKIGVLLSLTGSGASSGESSMASLELAQEDINNYLHSIGTKFRIKLFLEDTQTDTLIAQEKLRKFFYQEIRLVIGPYSSSELRALKNFADNNGILLVSPSSVAASLAIGGDNIFRLVTDDRYQAKAMSKILTVDSVKAVIALIRDDLWGNDLYNSTSQEFIKSGGIILNEIKYKTTNTTYNSHLSDLNTKLKDALKKYNSREVGIYLVSFEDGTEFLKLAKDHSDLSRVRWYGSSAFALTKPVLANLTAAQFASSVSLANPIFSLSEEAKENWQPLESRIESLIGRKPDAYAFTGYDALYIAAKSYIAAGTSNIPIETLKKAYTAEANKYFGVTGRTTLNEYGDRSYGDYNFWSVRIKNNKPEWFESAYYKTMTGELKKY